MKIKVLKNSLSVCLHKCLHFPVWHVVWHVVLVLRVLRVLRVLSLVMWLIVLWLPSQWLTACKTFSLIRIQDDLNWQPDQIFLSDRTKLELMLQESGCHSLTKHVTWSPCHPFSGSWTHWVVWTNRGQLH